MVWPVEEWFSHFEGDWFFELILGRISVWPELRRLS